MKKVALFHTSAATLAMMQNLAKTYLQDVEVMHLIEDSMIKDVMANGGITPEISARIAGYVQIAERAGCSHFMTACSSIGYAVESCQFMTAMQVSRIDTAMIEEAINHGGQITVLATVATTMEPTLEYLRRKAAIAGKIVEIVPGLMPEAFHALLAGDTTTHDAIVSHGLQEACRHSNVVMLAQASMARVLDTIASPSIPVLTSPERGIRWLAQQIKA